MALCNGGKLSRTVGVIVLAFRVPGRRRVRADQGASRPLPFSAYRAGGLAARFSCRSWVSWFRLCGLAAWSGPANAFRGAGGVGLEVRLEQARQVAGVTLVLSRVLPGVARR